MAENEGTTDEGVEAQADGNKPATGTQAAPDEVTTLRSRAAGLDAKVTELSKAAKAAEQRAAEAAQKLADYEAGKVGADEALRAQLSAKEAELATVRREATLARIEAKYPETFSVLGEAAAGLTPDQLAAAEVRFKGVAAGGEEETTQRPIGNNPSRTQGAASQSGQSGSSVAELEKRLFGFGSIPGLARD